MTAPILVSAYPLSPAHAQWDPVLEAELLPALCALPGVAGLEVPWMGGLHPHDDAWFLAHVPAVRLAVTPVPFVMRRVGEDPRYGLASPDAEGRAAAVADLQRVAADVARLTAESPATVAVVTLHTAPRETGSDAALTRSLGELATLDWSGAVLAIEHCDAFVPGQQPEKGFLPLDAEIAAIRDAQVPVGLWLNWGRSAIELRDADAVTAQIADAAGSGLLTGLAFSGAAAAATPYGPPWIDAHLPIAEAHPESQSLLDAARVADALAAAGPVPWLGLKAARRPDDRTVAEVLRTAARNLDLVRAAAESAA
ncbi:DUF4862 family protein [Microbacterium sp. p3-SID336]|uniref:DUF4862 family protein n=1 Tax=Microbacterium sp. p3-SID336 TaxID=2916212 RepID=UPI0021A81DBE|nr:DUF4862 family protein [Microbacterium sp. p3-SID336]MCT1480009.1 DUF4862 family protein [Microbacterium sp. p3-SID336]